MHYADLSYFKGEIFKIPELLYYFHRIRLFYVSWHFSHEQKKQGIY